MFLLFGLRPVDTLLFVVTFVCGQCGTRAAQQIVRTQQKVTLFFIPLISLGTSYTVQCSHCGMVTGLTRQQAEHSTSWAASHGIPVG